MSTVDASHQIYGTVGQHTLGTSTKRSRSSYQMSPRQMRRPIRMLMQLRVTTAKQTGLLGRIRVYRHVEAVVR